MTTPLPRCAMMSSLDCRRHATIASYGVGCSAAQWECSAPQWDSGLGRGHG